MKKLILFFLGTTVALSVGCFDHDSNAPKGENSGTKQAVPDKVTKLVTKDLVEGKGTEAEPKEQITVHYTGWLFDKNKKDHIGKKFDSSLDRNSPFSFRLGAGMVIKGWDKGIAGMKVGGKRRLFIPADMAYGDKGAGKVIPPGATLVFDVQLLDVKQD